MAYPLLSDEKTATVSEFSQGRSGKIFNDVLQNNQDYVVMKNNSPIAVIIPVEEYRNTRKRIDELEQRLKAYMSGISTANRIGVAKGQFNVNGDFDADNEEIASLLSGGIL